MRILLIGAAGQVGRALQPALASLGEVIALTRKSVPNRADLCHPAQLAETVRSLRPGVIINAAAYTAVDAAENDEATAMLVNADAPGALASAAQSIGAQLVHFGSDYVFDGSGSRAWTEADAPAPLNAYGRSKLAGEQAIAAQCERHLILRTSWVCSPHGHNFIRTMLRLARERTELRVVSDQWGVPTAASLIALVTAQAIAAGDTLPAGIYHLAPRGETNWHQLAEFVISHARRLAPDGGWRVTAITPVSSDDYPTAAVRPRNSRLDTTKLTSALGLELPPWQQDVEQTVAAILAEDHR